MPDIDEFESVRVVDESTAVKLAGVSPRTWDRMRARGETPPFTQISQRRIGYRIADLKAWLDARRCVTSVNAALANRFAGKQSEARRP